MNSVRVINSFLDDENAGLAFLNFNGPVPPERTLVVMGPPRSGTSMVTKVLAWLGIPVGVTKEANYEDPDFVRLLHVTSQGNVDRKRLRDLIESRNKSYPVWGFKVPMAIMALRLLEADLRHPYFIFVFRDLLAAAIRSNVSTGADILVSLRLYNSLYSEIWNFLEHTSSPCMLVSYEKAVRNQNLFTSKVAEFAGVGPEKVKLAAAQVQAGHY